MTFASGVAFAALSLAAAAPYTNTWNTTEGLDFVEINDYRQANGMVPYMTNALIRAATCEPKPILYGMTVLVR